MSDLICPKPPQEVSTDVIPTLQMRTPRPRLPNLPGSKRTQPIEPLMTRQTDGQMNCGRTGGWRLTYQDFQGQHPTKRYSLEILWYSLVFFGNQGSKTWTPEGKTTEDILGGISASLYAASRVTLRIGRPSQLRPHLSLPNTLRFSWRLQAQQGSASEFHPVKGVMI